MRSQGQAFKPMSQVPLPEETHQECTKREGHRRTQPEGGHLEAKERGLTLTLPDPWPWTFSLQNREKINVCCLSHPVCDISLWQLKLPTTPSHLNLIKPCQGCLLIKVMTLMKTTPFTEGLPCVRHMSKLSPSLSHTTEEDVEAQRGHDVCGLPAALCDRAQTWARPTSSFLPQPSFLLFLSLDTKL